MPKDTKTLGNSKARACESLGFVHKKGCARVLTHLLFVLISVYLLAENILLAFLISFTPSINPSKTAMPVLKARMIALPLSLIHISWDTDFDTYINEDTNYTQYSVAEAPWTRCV